MNKRKTCIICEVELNPAKSVAASNKSVRYLTCSKKCSKAFQRVRNYIGNRYRCEIKELKKGRKRR